MSENYTLDVGDAGLIVSKDVREVRLLLEKRDVIEEAELLVIGLSLMIQDAEWRRKVCLRAKEVLQHGNGT